MKCPPEIKLHDVDTGHQIIKKILSNYLGPVAIKLWDGTLAVGQKDAVCTVIIKHPGVLRELVLYRNVVKLAEYYLIEDIDINGDIECLFDLASYLAELDISWTTKLSLLRLAFKLPSYKLDNSVNSIRAGRSRRSNSQKSISHHYDVGNDFYNLWLDKEMVYSGAYFSDKEQTIDSAQQDKLDYICKKLRLTLGQTLLDIGCGWGVLISWLLKIMVLKLMVLH